MICNVSNNDLTPRNYTFDALDFIIYRIAYRFPPERRKVIANMLKFVFPDFRSVECQLFFPLRHSFVHGVIDFQQRCKGFICSWNILHDSFCNISDFFNRRTCAESGYYQNNREEKCYFFIAKYVFFHSLIVTYWKVSCRRVFLRFTDCSIRYILFS